MTRPRMITTLTAIAAIAAVTMIGCSRPPAGGSSDDSIAQPTLSAPPTFTPLESPPVEFRTVSGPHFRISVPGAWEERVQEQSTAEVKPIAILDTSAPAGSDIFVGIVVDKPAPSDVFAQSLVLEGDKRTGGATEVARESLTWPNSTAAVRLTWQETPRGATTAVQYEQLMVQVSPNVIVNAVASAPAHTYPDTQLETILRSLVVSP